MLIFSLGNSIIFTGVWPYLQLLEPTVTLNEYGFVVAADALAQMLFSPLFGYVVDKMNSVRLVSVICCIIFCIGNVLYANVAAVPRVVGSVVKARMWTMMFARFVVGIGTGINAAIRSYISKATYVEERTTHIALLSLFQTLGFIMGPAIQAALTPLGEEGEISKDSTFVSDMYTATGWVSAATGLLALILFMPGIFKEHKCENKPKPKKDGVAKAPTIKSRPRELLKQFSTISMVDGHHALTRSISIKPPPEKPPLLPTITSTYNFFSFLFNFVLIETILTPLAMDQWGWTEEDTIMYLGITMAAGGVLSGLCFATIGPLSKKFDERLLLIVAGLGPMIVGRIILFPYGSEYPPYKNVTLSKDIERAVSSVDGLTGCSYDWCLTIPKITVVQFMVGYVFGLLGYPFCVAICGSLFSKILGPIPQGFYMGLLTTSGSLARVVGPIFVSYIYQYYGTWLLFGIVTASLGVSLILTLVSYKQLVPYDSRK